MTELLAEKWPNESVPYPTHILLTVVLLFHSNRELTISSPPLPSASRPIYIENVPLESRSVRSVVSLKCSSPSVFLPR